MSIWNLELDSEDTPAPVRELAELMSSLSQDCYDAGWMQHTERALWERVCGIAEPSSGRGFALVKDADVLELRRLAIAAGGWIRWSDEGDLGETFVPMEEWIAITGLRLPS